MSQPRHLHLVPTPPENGGSQTRRVSGSWTLVAMAAGGLIGSLITTAAGVPWPHPMTSGPGGDIDLVAGMLAGGLAAGAVAATFVRRVLGATFAVPEWLRELTGGEAQVPAVVPIRADRPSPRDLR